MPIIRFCLIIIYLVLGPFSAHADPMDDGPEVRFAKAWAESPAASLSDLEWFVGLWKGEVFGGVVEHRNMMPHKGHMPGLVRLRTADSDEVSIYELSSFMQTGQTVTYRIRHFGADLVAFQEPDDYIDRPLIEMTEDTAYFDGITFSKTGDDTASVAFILTDDEGQQTRHLVRYEKQ